MIKYKGYYVDIHDNNEEYEILDKDGVLVKICKTQAAAKTWISKYGNPQTQTYTSQDKTDFQNIPKTQFGIPEIKTPDPRQYLDTSEEKMRRHALSYSFGHKTLIQQLRQSLYYRKPVTGYAAIRNEQAAILDKVQGPFCDFNEKMRNKMPRGKAWKRVEELGGWV